MTQQSALDFFTSPPPSLSSYLYTARDYLTIGASILQQASGVPLSSINEHFSTINSTIDNQTKWLPDADEEQIECEAFLKWAEENEHVRVVKHTVPPSAYSQNELPFLTQVEIYDFSTASFMDDLVYSRHRDIWCSIPRGCSMLAFHMSSSSPVLRWCVRANRKFTGHEDTEQDSKQPELYSIHSQREIEHVYVTHKANGSVLHFAARQIVLNNISTTWCTLGSKKVHITCMWSPHQHVDVFNQRMSSYEGERYSVVHEMLSCMCHHLSGGHVVEMIQMLSSYRLVINAEYITPSGSGPVDNRALYQSNDNQALGFALTFNTLHPATGSELCLYPPFAYYLLTRWSFSTVPCFAISLSESSLQHVKTLLLSLPNLEGSVLYYATIDGVIRLEKWKSISYVLQRCVREKLRAWFKGRKEHVGLEQLIKEFKLTRQAQNITVMCTELADFKKPQNDDEWSTVNKKNNKKKKNKQSSNDSSASSDIASQQQDELKQSTSSTCSSDSSQSSSSSSDIFVLDIRASSLDLLGSYLTTLGITTRHSDQHWSVIVHQPRSEFQQIKQILEQRYHDHVRMAPLNRSLDDVMKRVHERILAVNHIPIEEATRQQWLSDAKLFLKWLFQQIFNEELSTSQVMENYSEIWSKFRSTQ